MFYADTKYMHVCIYTYIHTHIGMSDDKHRPELPKSCLRTCQDVVRRVHPRAVHSIIATTVTMALLLAVATEPFMNYYYYYRHTYARHGVRSSPYGLT